MSHQGITFYKVEPELRKAIQDFMDATDRNQSNAVKVLVKRGLAGFREDWKQSGKQALPCNDKVAWDSECQHLYGD